MKKRKSGSIEKITWQGSKKQITAAFDLSRGGLLCGLYFGGSKVNLLGDDSSRNKLFGGPDAAALVDHHKQIMTPAVAPALQFVVEPLGDRTIIRTEGLFHTPEGDPIADLYAQVEYSVWEGRDRIAKKTRIFTEHTPRRFASVWTCGLTVNKDVVDACASDFPLTAAALYDREKEYPGTRVEILHTPIAPGWLCGYSREEKIGVGLMNIEPFFSWGTKHYLMDRDILGADAYGTTPETLSFPATGTTFGEFYMFDDYHLHIGGAWLHDPMGVDARAPLRLDHDRRAFEMQHAVILFEGDHKAMDRTYRKAFGGPVRSEKIPPAPKGWYNITPHTHSNYSDGRAGMKTIKQAARRQGFDIVLMTDHDNWLRDRRGKGSFDRYVRECLAQCEDDFLMLPGEEITGTAYNKLPLGNGHMNVYVADPEGMYLRLATDKRLDEWADDVAGYNGISIIHTPFYAEFEVDARYWDEYWTDNFQLIEVRNGHPAVFEGKMERSTEKALALWDRLLCEGKRVWAVFGTDCHMIAGRMITGGWDIIRLEDFSYPGILDAMKRGDIVATTGPWGQIQSAARPDGTFDITIEFRSRVLMDKIKIVLDGKADEEILIAANKTNGKVRINQSFDRYLRAELFDTMGGRALLQPVFAKL